MKYVNIIILFTLEKNLGIEIFFYCILPKRFEKKEVLTHKGLVYIKLSFRMSSENSHRENLVYFFFAFLFIETIILVKKDSKKCFTVI